MPTLVIQATDDTLIPMDAARALAARIPGSQLEIVENRDHLLGDLSFKRVDNCGS